MADVSVFVPLASTLLGAGVTFAAVMLADVRARMRERLRDEKQFERSLLVQRHQDQWMAWRQFLMLGSRLREHSPDFERIEHRYQNAEERLAAARRYGRREAYELHASIVFAFRDRRLANRVVDALEILAASRYGGMLAERAVEQEYQQSQSLMLAAIEQTEAALGIVSASVVVPPVEDRGSSLARAVAEDTPHPLTPPVEAQWPPRSTEG